jgi:hypothetical protein
MKWAFGIWILVALAVGAVITMMVVGVGDQEKAAPIPEIAKPAAVSPAPTIAVAPKAGMQPGKPHVTGNATLVPPSNRSNAPDDFAEYVNSRFGFTIRYPSKLLMPQGESFNGDGQGFISQDKRDKLSAYGSHTLLGGTLKDDFERELQANPNRQITYKVLRNNWYVISGADGGLIFYKKTVQVRDGYATFNFSYPIEHRGTWDKVLVEIANEFKPK